MFCQFVVPILPSTEVHLISACFEYTNTQIVCIPGSRDTPRDTPYNHIRAAGHFMMYTTTLTVIFTGSGISNEYKFSGSRDRLRNFSDMSQKQHEEAATIVTKVSNYCNQGCNFYYSGVLEYHISLETEQPFINLNKDIIQRNIIS